MRQWIYDLGIRLYGVGVTIASLFSAKARLWVNGRKDWESVTSAALSKNSNPVVWLHAASLGEFEQGRPIIESLRARERDVFIVLTFFSPSGFEVRKDYDQADIVMYMPLDTTKNAMKFVSIVQPEVTVFIKYEFWFNHLRALSRKAGKVYLASGRFHAKQNFFQPWGAWFKKGLESFDHFYLQDSGSAELLRSIAVHNYTVNGDTRFDRVISIKEDAQEISAISDFLNEEKCLVIGSSWPHEEAILLEHIKTHGTIGFKTIIAPHVIDDSRMTAFSKSCSKKVVRMSTWQGEEANVMFVDSIGLLARVFRYADVAFIGGAFGDGLHNILEPAVWSTPVLFGPRYQGFPEAIGLLETGGAKVVESQEDFSHDLLSLMTDDELRDKMAHAAGLYCEEQKGASKAIVEAIIKDLEEKIG